MVNVVVIFGTLIALNLGFGYWLSEKNAQKQPPHGVVEVEHVQPKPAAPAPEQPQAAPQSEGGEDSSAQ